MRRISCVIRNYNLPNELIEQHLLTNFYSSQSCPVLMLHNFTDLLWKLIYTYISSTAGKDSTAGLNTIVKACSTASTIVSTLWSLENHGLQVSEYSILQTQLDLVHSSIVCTWTRASMIYPAPTYTSLLIFEWLILSQSIYAQHKSNSLLLLDIIYIEATTRD